MGGLSNLREALALCRRAAPRLLAASAGVAAAQALLLVGQLLLLRHFGGLFLDLSTERPRGDAVRAVLPGAAGLIAGLVVLLLLDHLGGHVRDLLTERVRQASARRTHQAIGALQLIDFDRPEVHDRVQRASGTDFRPAQAVRALTAIGSATVRIVVVTAAVVAIQPLLVPALLLLTVPVVVVARLLAGDRHAFLTAVTPLERRRVYVHRILTARDFAAERRAFGLTPHFSRQYDQLSAARTEELRRALARQWRRMLAGQVAFALLVAGAVGLLGWFYVAGRSGLGELVAATVGLAQVAGLVAGLGWPLSELAEAGLFLQDQRTFLAAADGSVTHAARPGHTARPGPTARPGDAARPGHTAQPGSAGRPGSVDRAGDTAAPGSAAGAGGAGQPGSAARGGNTGPSVGAAMPGALRVIEVTGVAFTYPAGARPALDGVTLSVRRGEIVALVGRNGSGKSTLAKLLGGLYTPDEGAVSWNGADCRVLDAEALRDRVATVFQEFQTYAGTIADNVALDQPVEAGRLAAALTAAGFAPGDLAGDVAPDRLVGTEFDGGTGLSGGQRQRLAVARALYRRADLLILDEPTSSLDARAEHTLLREVRALGSTVVLVSHRLANVAAADRIVVLDAGRVVAEGTHRQLIDDDGIYAELYRLQAALHG